MRNAPETPLAFLGPILSVTGLAEGKRVTGYTFEVLCPGSVPVTLKYPDKKTATEMRRQIARTDGAHIIVSKSLFEAVRKLVIKASETCS